MRKRMFVMLILVGVLFALIILYKAFIGFMTKRAISENRFPIVPVSAMQVGYATWQPKLKFSGSLRAIKGVNVTTELAGMVQSIYFTPGAYVLEGEKLVQLNADTEIGQLRSLEAQTALADITYKRDKAQYAFKAVSQQTVDVDYQTLKNLTGQTAAQAATVAKKTIRAPFDGRLGINKVNPGQYLNAGDMIVSLQTLDPIYVDFYMPQQELGKIKNGLPISITSDIYPNQVYQGKITTINPAIETDTRNVEVEATIANPTHQLTPGMFAYVEILTGTPKQYLTLPQTAISYNPYGDIVFVVSQEGKDKKGPILKVKQAFVITGETRGDQVTILKGLKKGQVVVTSGQLKLKTGSRIIINNSVVPADNPKPLALNDH